MSAGHQALFERQQKERLDMLNIEIGEKLWMDGRWYSIYSKRSEVTDKPEVSALSDYDDGIQPNELQGVPLDLIMRSSNGELCVRP